MPKERIRRLDRKRFAAAVRSAMKRNGLTYVETARRLQAEIPDGAALNEDSVRALAAGRRLPRYREDLEAIARVLGFAHELVLRGGPDFDTGDTLDGLRIRDVDGHRAQLDLRAKVPWAIALQVAALIRGRDRAGSPAAARRPAAEAPVETRRRGGGHRRANASA